VFAAEAALAAQRWVSEGHGNELTGLDVREAYRYAVEAAQSIGQADKELQLRQILASEGPAGKRMRQVLEFVGVSP
jgi:hypothetical protein